MWNTWKNIYLQYKGRHARSRTAPSHATHYTVVYPVQFLVSPVCAYIAAELHSRARPLHFGMFLRAIKGNPLNLNGAHSGKNSSAATFLKNHFSAI